MESSKRLSSSSRVLCDMTEAGVWYPSACIMEGCAGVWAPLLAKMPPPAGPPLQVPWSGAKGLPLVTERGLLGAERPEESTARFSVSSRMMVLVPCRGRGPGCGAIKVLLVKAQVMSQAQPVRCPAEGEAQMWSSHNASCEDTVTLHKHKSWSTVTVDPALSAHVVRVHFAPQANLVKHSKSLPCLASTAESLQRH